MEQPDRFDNNIGTAGSTGSAGTGSVSPTDPPACVVAVFKSSCAVAGCHAAGTNAASGVDLASPGINARLVDVPTMHTDVAMGAGISCPPAKFIDTSNRTASWLLSVVTGKQGTCGTAMPQGTTGLTGTDLSCISDWINTVPPASASGGGGTGGTGGA